MVLHGLVCVWIGLCMHRHISFMCVCVGCDFLSRAERERVSDFVESFIFHCIVQVYSWVWIILYWLTL